MKASTREWIVDLLVGGAVGAVTGLIVAVNLVIFSGIETGYESSLEDVFRHSPVLGIAVVALMAAGPIIGMIVARLIRSRRD